MDNRLKEIIKNNEISVSCEFEPIRDFINRCLDINNVICIWLSIKEVPPLVVVCVRDNSFDSIEQWSNIECVA